MTAWQEEGVAKWPTTQHVNEKMDTLSAWLAFPLMLNQPWIPLVVINDRDVNKATECKAKAKARTSKAKATNI